MDPWYWPASQVGERVRQVVVSTVEDLGPDILALGPTTDPEDLETRAQQVRNTGRPAGNTSPQKAPQSTTAFKRDPRVVAWVRDQAAGRCDLCGESAPFLSRGEPFLEVHHVLPLAEEGPDVVENAVAVCPNCHRRLHHSDEGDLPTEILYERIDRLQKVHSTQAQLTRGVG